MTETKKITSNNLKILDEEEYLIIPIHSKKYSENKVKKIKEVLETEGIIFKEFSSRKYEIDKNLEPEEYPIVAIEDDLYAKLKKVSETFSAEPRDIVNVIIDGFLKNIMSDDLAALLCYFRTLMSSQGETLYQTALGIIEKLSKEFNYPQDMIDNLKTDLRHFVSYGISLDYISTLIPKKLIKKIMRERSYGLGSNNELITSALNSYK